MFTEDQVIRLRDYLNNDGYCQVNNILHPQLIKYLKIGSQLLESETQPENFSGGIYGGNINLLPLRKYGPIIGENLLIYLTPIYSQISGKNLIPTYSFYRKYFKTNILKKHKDRPTCQYAATIQIDSSKNEPWPIWIQNKSGHNIKCNSKIGDIIFYKGEEVLHWREKLEYKHSSHLFLFWVDKNNSNYKEYWYDGREKLGIPR